MSDSRIKFQKNYERLKEKEKDINITLFKWNIYTIIGLFCFSLSFGLIIIVILIEKDPIVILTNILNDPLRSISVYAFLLYIAAIIIIRRFGGKTRRENLTITLNNEDVIFLRFFELYGCLNNFIIESKGKEHYRKNALSKMGEIMDLVDDWNIGNLMLIDNVLSEKINILEKNLNNINGNIKYGNDADINKLLNISDKILDYFLNPDLIKLDILLNSFNMITIKEHIDKTYMDKIWDLTDKKPIESRLLCPLLLIILFILVSYRLGFGIPPFWSLLLVYVGLLQAFNIIFNLRHTGIKLIPDKSQETTNNLHDVELINEDFENYISGDKLKSPWISDEDQGNILIVTDVDAPWTSKKCVKIEGLKRTNIKYVFGDAKKVNIEYYIKNIYINEYRYGSPFIIESSDSINRNGPDNRAIYMEINKNILRYGYESKNSLDTKEFTIIDDSKWYHIILNIDCVNHTYELLVNDKKEKIMLFPEFNSVNAIRTKCAYGQKWQTLIGNIKIEKYKL